MAMNRPTVSVIIPTYNRRELIGQAIDSVLAQTYSDYELIVVDDGSTDGTPDLISNKYANNLCYYRQENQGRSVARNYGASIAKGNYLAFLDSDDYWAPEKLSAQIDYMSSVEDTDVALVCCSVLQIDENGRPRRNEPIGRHPHLNKYGLEHFFYSQVIYASPSNILVKRTCFEQVGGFDPRLEYGEDWDLLIRLRAQWKFGYIDRPLLFYRSHTSFDQDLPESSEIDFLLDQSLMILRKSYKLLNSEAVGRVKSRMESTIYERGAFWCFCRDAWDKGLQYLRRAAVQDPTCVIDKRRICQNIALWGACIGIMKFGQDGRLIEEYFRSRFLKRVIEIWPVDLLPKRGLQRRILGAFYHNLGFQLKHKPSRYSMIALFYEPRYLFSPRNWNLILEGVMHPF